MSYFVKKYNSTRPLYNKCYSVTSLIYKASNRAITGFSPSHLEVYQRCDRWYKILFRHIERQFVLSQLELQHSGNAAISSLRPCHFAIISLYELSFVR